MRKQSSAPFDDSWSDTQELSPKEVCSLIQKHWSAIAALPKKLVETQKLFASTQTIWPDQCSWIIDDFRLLTERVQLFSDFLDTSSLFSGSFRLIRYPLAQKLHYFDAQLCELCVLLVAFRAHCHVSTYDTTCQVQEISSLLKRLLQQWRQIRREIQIVLKSIDMSAREEEIHPIIHIKSYERPRR